MAGIYLHIPFCKQACNYCNFHFTTSLRYKDDLVAALAKEISLQKDYLVDATVNTIYFGGGTPSLLSIDDCRLLIENIRQTFSVAEDAEITLEANPDDITADKLKGWKDTGINRLSIGVQSFFEEELRWMNRAHTANHARQCIELSLAAGITNLTIDLIYGSPLLTNEMWEQNVQTAIQYNIPHLSCYALTVEERTPLHKLISNHQKLPVDADKQGHQFLLLMQWLRAAGYDHYEVSNFAKPGHRSRHNSSYWKGQAYLGLGPSAHSFNGTERQWNVANNQQYISAIQLDKVPFEKEILSSADQLNEYLMISLRTMEGIDLNVIENKWGHTERERLLHTIKPSLAHGTVTQQNHHLKLTDEGLLLADGIAASLFK
ncbi:radical SAM family heme chaperone HemW [Flavisolibacter tropicus]|uniref:Heme chaperone HemW n=1 Tax=Flavisolibacter tropicus TaxID=1492898 RepID=A0A172U0H2_9BACT|nr:radical SAM family heme chaperone HemW [Flavisolibacter tropicus]ANE52487.1 coproporphyrinogen III oxidase [Flavisolibacter tropicus]